MAKSLRSKRMRKNRRILREKYSKRELETLYKTIAHDPLVSNLVTMVDADDIKRSPENTSEDTHAVAMETNRMHVYNEKTLLDQHGSYPGWMTKKAIQRHKALKNKRQKMKQKRRVNKKR